MIAILQGIQVAITWATIIVIDIVIFFPIVQNLLVKTIEMGFVIRVKTEVIKELVHRVHQEQVLQVDVKFLLGKLSLNLIVVFVREESFFTRV
jgi:hypothetical protein